ncbi:MAG TPA: glycerophosphodiester phosphodiesterase family protein [Actinopolymorphaceae bacterium]
MKVLPTLGLLVITAMVASTVAPRVETVLPGSVDVIAHRGSSGVAPENTAPAIEAAVAQGADFVEIDVQRTKDGRLVNFHDCTLMRTTDVEQRFPGRPSYRVSDFTWDELRTLDAGSWFDDDFAGEPIVSVREVAARVRGRTGLLAEMSPCKQYDGLAADLAAELRAIPGYVDEALGEGRLAVQTFVVADAEAFHALEPDVPIGILDSERPTDEELTAWSRWARQVNPDQAVTDASLIERIHELGMTVNVWTVNDPARARALVELGVDGIITDYPQAFVGR